MKKKNVRRCAASFEDQWPVGTIEWAGAIEAKNPRCNLRAGHEGAHSWDILRTHQPARRAVRFVVGRPSFPMQQGVRIIRQARPKPYN